MSEGLEVPLTKGFVTTVDADDYEAVVEAGPWHVHYRHSGLAYAQRNVVLQRAPRRRTTQQLHSFLTGWPLVDHVNGDGLDNRRHNLRQATRSQNAANVAGWASNTSGYRGVRHDDQSPTRPWRAQLQTRGRVHFLGRYATRVEAARAVDRAAIEFFGEYARLNLPRESRGAS